jgi:hypothetical protein
MIKKQDAQVSFWRLSPNQAQQVVALRRLYRGYLDALIFFTAILGTISKVKIQPCVAEDYATIQIQRLLKGSTFRGFPEIGSNVRINFQIVKEITAKWNKWKMREWHQVEEARQEATAFLKELTLSYKELRMRAPDDWVSDLEKRQLGNLSV